MKVLCRKVSEIKNEAVFRELEERVGFKLPDGFEAFFRQNNGGVPENRYFEIDGGEYEISNFLSFNDGDIYSIKQPLKYFLQDTNGKIIPFAVDSGSDYYCINIESGKVYYWDHNSDLYYPLAESFSLFTELL